MSSIFFGIGVVSALLVLVGTGMPVAVAMGLTAMGGMWLAGGSGFMLATIETLPYAIVSDYTFVVVPMFLLMGIIAAEAKFTKELYDAAYRCAGRWKGNLYIATTLASAGFAAVSGSSVVNAAVFTRVALPEMIRLGYDRALSAGCIAASGTFAALIPPSIGMVIYAILTGESLGKLLIAGVVPGALTVVAYIISIPIMLKLRPAWAPEGNPEFSIRERVKSLAAVWPIIALSVLVLGGIYTGMLFPSAAGAVGAVGALIIGLARRRLGKQEVWNGLKTTANISAVIFLIIISGLMFSRALVYSGFIHSLTTYVTELGLSPIAFIACIVVMYLILGMFIDAVSVMVMTVPFVYPLIIAMGLDPIWFGVILIKLIEIAAITPPIGLNLFAVQSASDGAVNARQVFTGVIPFICIESIVLVILLMWPELSLWLPNTMS